MAPRQTPCRTCGTEPRPGAKFCDACGTAIALDTTELKQVTVLFADVVRSMDLAAALDSERLRDVMSELFTGCAAIVQQFGGTVDKFTGDGIMALFGAPIALEDHAARACRAALEMQRAATRFAAGVQGRDGIGYAVRVGLNSGGVVTGQIGSGPTSYTAVGVHVGLAQRMEAAAPTGGVMLSESTARLVDPVAVLGERELVTIKGSAAPVPARRLLAMKSREWLAKTSDDGLVGRDAETAAISAMLDRAGEGAGCIVGIEGPAGIGKSRVALELSASARTRGIRTISTFCESHASGIPFYVVARLLRDAFAIGDVDDATTRDMLRAKLAHSEPGDVALLEELFGLRNGDGRDPRVSTDARRRRLSRLLHTEALARATPTVLLIEDAHWIDSVSEAMLTEFCTLAAASAALVVITYRPEYLGALRDVHGLHRLALTPLRQSDSLTLVRRLVGSHPSLRDVVARVVTTAAGNPFFVQELVLDLVERGILAGRPGAYACHGDSSDLAVPPTLHAAIAARIDRLGVPAKRVLNAAALIGSQFDTDLLATALDTDRAELTARLEELVAADLLDPVALASLTEYAFRHPLIRAVASESQLRSDRARTHRRLAAAIERRSEHDPDQDAGLIGTHLESAGDLREAFAWYMRAGAWFTNRDIGAARTNWQRAKTVADAIPHRETDRPTMRIAPRSLLCGSTWRAGGSVEDAGFEELRRLCVEADQPIPLAMGMAGYMSELSVHARPREANELVPEYVALIDSMSNPEMTVGLLFAAIYPKHLTGELQEALQLAERVIDLAHGDPRKGNVLTGSPLAFAMAMRGTARCCLGYHGWRADLDDANAIAHAVDPTTYVSTVMFKYTVGIAVGALVVDDTALAETRAALDIATTCSEDMALGLAQLVRGVTLTHTGSVSDRASGLELLSAAKELADAERFSMTELPLIDTEHAAQRARSGDLDGAVNLARHAVNTIADAGMTLYLGAAATVLVCSLLERNHRGDVDEARRAVDALATTHHPIPAHHELPLLRLRAEVAAALGDDTDHREFARRYRSRARALGFLGHMAISDSTFGARRRP
ncbi:MAG: adenylate/guanylate cyclase protein [Mycobacterium sp.]|jgi:class 3 adenylate cyclase|nr:adenylate/guanylate cyclase protein [Mycobacterium sp.]MDT5177635.1 hypothetical protein [Mycobacterium sp.]